MFNFYLFCLSAFSYGFFMFFKKKLLCLLYLEGIMLSIIVYSSSYLTFMGLLILSFLMVLDSVLGVTLFLGASRIADPQFDSF